MTYKYKNAHYFSLYVETNFNKQPLAEFLCSLLHEYPEVNKFAHLIHVKLYFEGLQAQKRNIGRD
jgi:hypothetical protein